MIILLLELKYKIDSMMMNYYTGYTKSMVLIVIIISVLYSLTSYALINENLYKGEVEVGTRQEAERIAALEHAMVQVVTRLTGKHWVVETEQLKGVLASAADYVRSYRYSTKIDELGIERIFLTVDFERLFIRNVMAAEELTLWPPNRPVIALWGIVQQDKELIIINHNTVPESVALVSNYNNRYGTAVRVPLGDLRDVRHVKSDNICQATAKNNSTCIPNIEALRDASVRYDAENIFAGVLSGTEGARFFSRWRYYYADPSKDFSDIAEGKRNARNENRDRKREEKNQKDFDFENKAILLSCGNKKECLSMALDALREILIRQDSVLASEWSQDKVSIRINNIHDYVTYLTVSEYLEKLSLTEYVVPKVFYTGGIEFEVGTQGTLQLLAVAAKKDKKLELADTDQEDDYEAKQSTPIYYWLD